MFVSTMILTGLSGCGSLHSGGGHNHFASNSSSNVIETTSTSEPCHSSVLSYVLSNKPLLVTSNEIETLQEVEDFDKSSSSLCRDSLSLYNQIDDIDLSSDSKRYIFTSRIRV